MGFSHPILLLGASDYELSFQVTDFNEVPLDYATITVNGQANAPGDYLFNFTPGDTLSYYVTSEGYMFYYGNIEPAEQDTTVLVRLWEKDDLFLDPGLGYRMRNRPFASDSQNNYHMILQGWEQNKATFFPTVHTSVQYMEKLSGGDWGEPETVHPEEFKTHHGRIAITPDDRVFVGFEREAEAENNIKSRSFAPHSKLPYPYNWDRRLYVSEKTQEGWVLEQIPTPTTAINFAPELVADKEGNLHMTWVSAIPEEDIEDPDAEGLHNFIKIAYATNMSGEWDVQLLDQTQLDDTGMGAAPKIAVSDNGVVHMVYRGYHPESSPGTPLYRIYYATNLQEGGSFWEIEMLETGHVHDGNAHIALDGEDVHIAFQARDGFDNPPHTYYINKKNYQWSDYVHVNQVDYGAPSAIIVDKDKLPVITYIQRKKEENEQKIFICKPEGESFKEQVAISLSLDLHGVEANDLLYDTEGNLMLPLSYSEKDANNNLVRKINLLYTPLGDITSVKKEEVGNSPLVYPNPAGNSAFVEIPEQVNGKISVRIFNMSGQHVYNHSLQKEEGVREKIHVDVSDFPGGLYLVNLSSANGKTATTKLLVW